MRLLIDTNIFLEVILEQERAQEARELLSRSGEHDMFISDYSLRRIEDAPRRASFSVLEMEP